MTQRIFDIENEKDYADLWDILPDDVIEIRKSGGDSELDNTFFFKKGYVSTMLISINWHNVTKITRPVNYEDMIGCVGWFWDDSKADDTPPCLGVLTAIAGGEYYTQVETWGYDNFRLAKKSELKFWGE